MEKRTRSLSRSPLWAALAAGALVAACQSNPKADPSGDPAAEPKTDDRALESVLLAPSPKTVEDAAFEIALSASRVADGALLRATLKPKTKRDLSGFKAVFEGMEFPVVPRPAAAEETEYDAYVVVPFNSAPRGSEVTFKWSETEGGVRKEKRTSVPIEVVDGQYRSEKLTVDPKQIDPPKKVVKRILREQKEIGAIYRKHGGAKLWSGPFAYPLDSEMTSPFGNKRIYNGKLNGFHQGLDLRARTPLPVKAPEAAKVALAKDLYFTGWTVILDHGQGLYTIYAHMSKLDVKKGDAVEKGRVLGLTGATGRSSGPHLHWGAVLRKLKFNPQDLTRVLR